MLLRFISAGALALAIAFAQPASAAVHIPVAKWCLCITAAGAWTMKAKNGRPCDRVCNNLAQQKRGELTEVSSARRMHAQPFRRYVVRYAARRHLHRGVVVARAPVETFDRDGRVTIAASAPIPHIPLQGKLNILRDNNAVARVATTLAVDHSRPADCYGIQWCGCWLRHHFGIADRSLNLAINWARMGSPASPDSANVVVWRHHVGKLLAYENGRILVQSGNDGGAVRTRWLSPHILGGVVAWRRV